jgi:exonuclease III
MVQWNANSIVQRKHELEDFLTSNRIDVAAICETKLTPRRKLKIPGYSIYRQDRNAHGGGVLILVHNEIQHDNIQLAGNMDMEQVAFIIHSPPDKRLLIVSGYNPPNRKLRIQDLNTIFDPTLPVVLLGDLNSKNIAWYCETTNTNGRILMDYCSDIQ